MAPWGYVRPERKVGASAFGWMGRPRRVPELPSTANDRRQPHPLNLKETRALNSRATHGNTLVMRSSAFTGSAIGSSTAPCTSSPSAACGATRPPWPTSSAAAPKAKPTGRSPLHQALPRPPPLPRPQPRLPNRGASDQVANRVLRRPLTGSHPRWGSQAPADTVSTHALEGSVPAQRLSSPGPVVPGQRPGTAADEVTPERARASETRKE